MHDLAGGVCMTYTTIQDGITAGGEACVCIICTQVTIQTCRASMISVSDCTAELRCAAMREREREREREKGGGGGGEEKERY